MNGEALYRICQSPEIPSAVTVFRWLAQREDFRNNYARAREVQTELMEEEILRIAYSATPEDYNPARLQVDALKWLMSKRLPKKYGDATMLKHADADGNALRVEVTRVTPRRAQVIDVTPTPAALPPADPPADE